MGIIGNRYLQGQPILPYPAIKTYQNADVFLDLAFVDHTQTPVVPTSIQLEVDDITNAEAMFGPSPLVITGSTTAPLYYPAFSSAFTLQVAGAIMQMTFPYEGSQLCQFKFSFTAVDSVTGNVFTAPALVLVELCSAATVSGSF